MTVVSSQWSVVRSQKKKRYLFFCFLLFTFHFSLFTNNSWAVHPVRKEAPKGFTTPSRLSNGVHPSKLKFEPLEFNPPQSEVVLLNNGIILHMIEDHELPTIDMTAVIRTGSVYEPEDKIGLAGMAGTVMRTGGTTNMKGEEINETLEFIAGSVEIGIGGESGTASMSVMKKDIDTGLKIFADVLMNPAFS